MLFRMSASRPVLTGRAAFLFILAGAAVCALPTFQVMPAAAEPGGAAGDKTSTAGIFVAVGMPDDAKQEEAPATKPKGPLAMPPFKPMKGTVIAIDPNTGKWQRISDGSGITRIRVSPDKQSVAFNKHEEGVWTCATAEGSAASRIVEQGAPAAWSPDGKQLIVNESKFEEGKGWTPVASWRMKADGKDATKLAIPGTDGVHDWSLDGKWLLTGSDLRPDKGRGYQLYVMRLDGTEERQLTKDGGINTYARFSPDGRQVAYLHHETETSSIWVVNTDGTDARKILEEEDLAGVDKTACWSPDGKKLVVGRFDWKRGDDGKKVKHFLGDSNPRLEIMDADGKNRKELKLDDLKPLFIGHPDWR